MLLEPLSQEAHVQDAHPQGGRDSDQVRGLVRHNTSEDAYFHISVLPAHRRFLRFAFGGEAYNIRSSRSVPGRDMGLGQDAGTVVSCLGRSHPQLGQESAGRPATHCEAVSEAAGSHGSGVQRNPARPPAHEAPSVVAPGQRVFSQGKPISSHQGLAAYPSSLGCLERPNISVPKPHVGGSMSSCDANNGRFPHGVGCGHEWPLRPGSVERPASLVAHKVPGDDGGVFGVKTLPPGPARSPYIGPHGQYCGGLLHQPPMVSPISPFVQASMSGPLVVSGQTPLFEGHLYPGTVECQSRCPVEPGAEAWGMASPPRGGGVHMAEVLQSPGGSVCNPGDLALSPLVLSLSPSPGCHGAVVAEAMPVCLSPDPTAPWSSGESSLGWSPSPPGNT
ncbi:hypothetical protein Q7C36_023530 [Tachysurus vachellii]|uniref:Uncharacterized protein n=1 Tax=Tachysurus vachellii TaxID=175792 RepID=A0AA88LJU1_TACVA|nr:hypothetical protein Q7C36_023530 [Tachysurus vachellii]